jgi:hypothetical protein
MIEIIPHGNGYRWRWIGATGRTLAECFNVHTRDVDAWTAAKAFRIAFWAVADGVDHRQGRCI